MIYTHDVLDELIKLLCLPRSIVDMSSSIKIVLSVGDVVRVTYETCAEKTKDAASGL